VKNKLINSLVGINAEVLTSCDAGMTLPSSSQIPENDLRFAL
jgi:hypothetical protein